MVYSVKNGNLTLIADISEQPDWNQVNPNKKDFIKNKPDLDSLIDGAREDILEAIKGLKRYSISFDANGGDQSSCPEDFETYHNIFLLDATIPTRNGFVFVGWSIDYDGIGDYYSPYTSIMYDQDVILYAIWKIETPLSDVIMGQINGSSKAGTVDDPIRVELEGFKFLDLPELKEIFQTIDDSGKYVILDVSRRLTESPDWFSHFNDGSNTNGKSKIVEFILPNTITILNPKSSYSVTLKFKDYTNLKKLIGYNVTTIGPQSFMSSTSLTHIIFPKTTFIDEDSFAFCSNLEYVEIIKIQHISSNAFDSIPITTFKLGKIAPTLGDQVLQWSGNITIKVMIPSNSVGYGDIPTSVSDVNWGNGFRGRGWDGNNILDGPIFSNITLVYEIY